MTATCPGCSAPSRPPQSANIDGHCTFKHKQAGGNDDYVLKLDDGTTFTLRGSNHQGLQQVQTHSGIQNVRHRNADDHEVFLWNDGEPRRLLVKFNTVQHPDATFDDDYNKEKRSNGERHLLAKGYSFRGGANGIDSSFSSYQQPGTGHCVGVQTTNGRYEKIACIDMSNCN